MNKKILIGILVLGIFLFSFTNVSAISIDYSNEDKIAHIKDTILFGLINVGEQGTMELKSHNKVTDILEVGLGWQVTMYYDANFKKEYKDALGEVTFINRRNGKEIEKEYKFVYWEEEEYDSPIYECSEEISSNGTIGEVCNILRTETKIRGKWIDYNSKDLPKGKIRIGIMVNNKQNEYIDGVWEVQGEKLKKHSEWTASLNTNLIAYYKLDEGAGATGIIIDSVGNFNGTNVGADNITGKILSGYNSDGSTEYINLDNQILSTTGSDPYSIFCWIRTNVNTADRAFFSQYAGGTNRFTMGLSDATLGKLRMFKGSPTLSLESTTSIDGNVWRHAGIIKQGNGTTTLYVNSNPEATTDSDGRGFDTGNTLLLSQQIGAGRFPGDVDECFIYNFSITETQLEIIYDIQKDGFENGSYTDDFSTPPTSTLGTPNAEAIVINPSVNFTATGVDNVGLSNMSLIINNSYVVTNSSPLNNTLTKFPYTLTTLGLWNWSVEVCDDENTCTNATFRNITFDNDLTITLNDPADLSSSILETIAFNGTATDDTEVKNISLIINGLYNQTNSTVFNNTKTTFITTLGQGFYNWTMETCDEFSCINATNRSLEIHTTPASLIILNPTGEINFHLLGSNLTVNWSITEEGVNLTEHIKECLIGYNGNTINVTDICTTTNETTFLYADGINNLTMNITEKFGFVTSNSTSWSINLLELNQTFNNETTEGNLENFEAKIKLISGLSISATALIYNGTTNIGSNSEIGGIITLSISNLLIPNVAADINLSFYWSLVFSDSSIINLSTKNQTVFNLDLDNCSSFTNRIFNFTSFDEEIQTTLSNTTKEIAINIYSSDRSIIVFNLSDEYKTNPSLICLNKNLTEDSRYSLDAIIKYNALGYANEYYNIVDLELTNETEEQTIRLYNLNESDSTEFQLTFTGQDFLPVEDALIFVERQYIAENTFKTVELPKTDSNGQTVLHLVRNDIVYNIIVMKDKEVLGRFSNLIAFCDDFSIGDCQIALNAIGEDSGVPNYDEELGIIFDSNPEYNETTKIISFSFTSTDGTSKIVNMSVERRDIFGNTTVCFNALVSTSGTLSCNVGNISESSLVTVVSVDGITSITSQVQIDSEGYGSIGYVGLFIITLSLILFLGDSKNGIIIATIIGYIIAITMGWLIGGIVGLGSSGIWIIILTFVAMWQINKDRSN